MGASPRRRSRRGQAFLALLIAIAGLASQPAAAAEETPDPALKVFTVAPHTDIAYTCPPGRQIYFVQAVIERQTIPVILLDAAGAAIPEDVFTSARGFRLDRAHEHPVKVTMSCGK